MVEEENIAPMGLKKNLSFVVTKISARWAFKPSVGEAAFW
jgi:hypothetical protein